MPIESKALKELDNGDCFWYNTFPHMKIAIYKCPEKTSYNVVGLKNGECFYLDNSTPVLFDPTLRLVNDLWTR